jgi:hypothetical protein
MANDGQCELWPMRPGKDWRSRNIPFPPAPPGSRQINMPNPLSRINNPADSFSDRILGALPFFYVFANTTLLNRTINNGAEIATQSRFEAQATLPVINRTKVTWLPVVKTDFSMLRACICGCSNRVRRRGDRRL